MVQWLINLIAEKVIAEIGIPPTFIDRGDPGTVDWTAGDFTKDNTWRDLDLSSIVPENAKGVALSVAALCEQIGINVYFRKKGNVNTPNRSRLQTQVGYGTMPADITVACDENRKIQYLMGLATWLSLEVTVKGWWL